MAKFNLLSAIILLFCIKLTWTLETYRYLKIVDTYETILNQFPDSLRTTYGTYLDHHISMLKRIHVPLEFDTTGENFAQTTCSVLHSNATACQNPIALFLGGGTASGKSSITKMWTPIFQNQTCGYVHIDPDAIMMEMPEWKVLVNGSQAECAAQELHVNASLVALRCYEEALSNNMSVVYDGTMSGYEKTVQQVQLAMKRGYEIQMFGVTVDIDVAAERSWSRAEVSKRYVPLCTIWSTHTGYSKFYADYAESIPTNQLYDNSGVNPYLIAQNSTVINETLYQKFINKSTETIGEVESELNSTVLLGYEKMNYICGTCENIMTTTPQRGNAEAILPLQLQLVAALLFLHFIFHLYFA